MDRTLTQENGTTIVATSKWHGWNKYRYTIVEGPSNQADGQRRRYAVVTHARETKGGIKITNIPEFENPTPVGCPPGLMRLLDEHPPLNEEARIWRQRVRDAQQTYNRRTAVFQKLRRLAEEKTPSVVLLGGRVVQYTLMPNRGKLMSAYRNETDGRVMPLPHDIVDIDATLALMTGDRTSTAGPAQRPG